MAEIEREIRKIQLQHPGGVLLQPVQTLVATIIFGQGENANESPLSAIQYHAKRRCFHLAEIEREIRKIQL